MKRSRTDRIVLARLTCDTSSVAEKKILSRNTSPANLSWNSSPAAEDLQMKDFYPQCMKLLLSSKSAALQSTKCSKRPKTV